MGGRWVATLAVGILLLGGIGSALSTATSPAAPPPQVSPDMGWINVTSTHDYEYQPASFENVPTNAIITVMFVDADALPHSFTIDSREGFVIPTSYSDSQLTRFLSEYPPLYSSLVNSGGQQSGTFQSPATPGWYEFVCNVSGHFQSGMYGFIAFGENLPSNLTIPNRVGVGGTSLTAIEAGGVGVGVLLVLVGILVWRRRRAPYVPLPPSPPKGSP
jgi:plastocyanin